MNREKISQNKKLIAGVALGFAASMCIGYNYSKNSYTNDVNLYNLEEMQEAINAGKVTTGYNVIRGNPASVSHRNGMDPGFSAPIFAYELSDIGNYSGYYQANGYYIVAVNTCETTAVESLFKGMSSYSSFLYTKAGFWVGTQGFGFGASTVTRTYQSKFYEDMKILISAEKSCSIYEVKMQSYGLPPPSENLLRGLATLPEEYNEQYYMFFYEEMGTHFQVKSAFGAAEYFDAFYQASEFAEAYAYYYHHQAGISLGFIKAESETTDAQLYLHEQQQKATDLQEHIIGVPSKGKTTEEWQDAIASNPLPISYTLSPIFELFRTDWLAKYTDKNLNSIYNNLVTALSNYCTWMQDSDPSLVAYCGSPPPDLSAGPGPWFSGTEMYELNGSWENWVTPYSQTSSVWQVGEISGQGMVSLCVVTASGGQDCGPNDSGTQYWTTLNVNGPLNYIGAWIQPGYGLVDFQMGWLENGEQQYTQWAFNNHQGEMYTLYASDGMFLSLRSMYQSGYGIVQMQVFNLFVPDVGTTYVGESD